MNFPGGDAHEAQEPCPVTHLQGHPPAGSPTPEAGRGRRLTPRALPALRPQPRPVRAHKTTGSNAQLLTTENSGRGQTQCRKQDRIQVPRQPAVAGGPRRAHSIRPIAGPARGTEGPLHSTTPAASCRRVGSGRTPGPWPPRQLHTWVPAPPRGAARPHSVTDAWWVRVANSQARGEGAAPHRH